MSIWYASLCQSRRFAGNRNESCFPYFPARFGGTRRRRVTPDRIFEDRDPDFCTPRRSTGGRFRKKSRYVILYTARFGFRYFASKMIGYIGYIRVSTVKQGLKGVSLQEQR